MRLMREGVFEKKACSGKKRRIREKKGVFWKTKNTGVFGKKRRFLENAFFFPNTP